MFWVLIARLQLIDWVGAVRSLYSLRNSINNEFRKLLAPFVYLPTVVCCGRQNHWTQHMFLMVASPLALLIATMSKANKDVWIWIWTTLPCLYCRQWGWCQSELETLLSGHEKAFDTVDHFILLSKLHKYCLLYVGLRIIYLDIPKNVWWMALNLMLAMWPVAFCKVLYSAHLCLSSTLMICPITWNLLMLIHMQTTQPCW